MKHLITISILLISLSGFSQCCCGGSLVTSSSESTQPTCNECENFTVVPCDDGNPCTISDVKLIDDCDGVSECQPCIGTLILDCSNTTNVACNDNDDCTSNDIEVRDCDGSVCVPCAGTPNLVSACIEGVVVLEGVTGQATNPINNCIINLGQEDCPIVDEDNGINGAGVLLESSTGASWQLFTGTNPNPIGTTFHQPQGGSPCGGTHDGYFQICIEDQPCDAIYTVRFITQGTSLSIVDNSCADQGSDDIYDYDVMTFPNKSLPFTLTDGQNDQTHSAGFTLNQ